MIAKNTMMAACVAGVMMGNAFAQVFSSEVEFNIAGSGNGRKVFRFEADRDNATGRPVKWQSGATPTGSSYLTFLGNSSYGKIGPWIPVAATGTVNSATYQYGVKGAFPKRLWGWTDKALVSYALTPRDKTSYMLANRTSSGFYNNLTRLSGETGNGSNRIDYMDQSL